MNIPIEFMADILKQSTWIPIWGFYLIGINMASIAFWKQKTAKIIFFTFMVSAILVMSLYSIYGYQKILGLGHILWIPLILYLLSNIKKFDSAYKIYLQTYIVSISISLIFDITDVYKYFSK